MKQKLNRGFTLIELLVVIAIIGILASVVLASLNTARDKGTDAANKSNLNNMRAQAELFYDDTSNTYTGLCSDPTVANAVASAGAVCLADATRYIFAVDLTDGTNSYCVDNTGAAEENAVAAATEDNDYVCDGNGT